MLEELDRWRGNGPLRDVTVLDFTQMMMGPVATMLMADLGALVLKIERPDVGEWERSYFPFGAAPGGDESPFFNAMNRNKLSCALDLKDPADLDVVRRLVPECDVLCHNYRPGVMERLGLGFDDVHALNPALVYVSGSGFGAAGRLAQDSGQDLLLQAFSGFAAQNGTRDLPPVPCATPVLDAASAFLMGFGAVSAVLEARSTGEGRQVGVSLLGTSLVMQCQQAFLLLNGLAPYSERSESGVSQWWSGTPYGIYETRDGYLAVAMAKEEVMRDAVGLAAAVDGVDRNGSEAWAKRRDEVDAAFRARLLEEPTMRWKEKFDAVGIWSAPLQRLEETLSHPQVEEAGFLREVEIDGTCYRVVGSGLELSGEHRAVHLAPPKVGEHTSVIKAAVGLDDA